MFNLLNIPHCLMIKLTLNKMQVNIHYTRKETTHRSITCAGANFGPSCVPTHFKYSARTLVTTHQCAGLNALYWHAVYEFGYFTDS